jgi:O-antigen/teichoic acid export membrane protein
VLDIIMNLSRARLVKDTSVTFLANLCAAIVLLITSILLARIWGPPSFGVLATLLTVVSIIVDTTDFGIGITLVRLVGKYRVADPMRYQYILLVALMADVGIGLLLAFLGMLIAPSVSFVLFRTDQYTSLVRIGLISSSVWSAAAYVAAILKAHERFFALAAWAVLPIILRSLCMLGAAIWGRSLEAVMLGYLASTVVSSAVGMLLVIRLYWPQNVVLFRVKLEVIDEVFHFAKWIALSIVLGTIASRFDVLLLSALSNPDQVGIYAVAVQLAAISPLVLNTLNTALIPRVSKLRTRDDYRVYLRNSLSISAIVSAGYIFLILVGEQLVRFLYGSVYSSAAEVLRLLLLAHIITVLAWPWVLIIYAVDRPDIQTKVNAIQIAVLLVGNCLLIPSMGAKAPAVMFLIATIIGLTLIGVWITLVFRKRNTAVESISRG